MSGTSEVLKDFLDRQIAADPEMRDVHSFVLGPSDTKSMASLVASPLKTLGFRADKVLFATASVGAVFGFESENGDRLVLKIFPERVTESDLTQILQVQRLMIQAGYPAPCLRSDLLRLDRKRLAVAMEFVEGEEISGHKVWVRKALASHLAWFSEIVDREGLQPIRNAFAREAGKLWPPNHKPGPGLERTQRGAAFMRDRARYALSTIKRADLSQRLGHTDWGVKNARFKGKKLVAVFDWDSLATMSEAEMVGRAAAMFTAHWEIPTRLAPTPEEANSFVEEYQQSRGRHFDKKEMAVVSAAADYIIALIARREYTGQPHGDNTFGQLVRELGSRPLIEAPKL